MQHSNSTTRAFPHPHLGYKLGLVNIIAIIKETPVCKDRDEKQNLEPQNARERSSPIGQTPLRLLAPKQLDGRQHSWIGQSRWRYSIVQNAEPSYSSEHSF